jgi:starvation-inducible outer membrane lipoprotein
MKRVLLSLVIAVSLLFTGCSSFNSSWQRQVANITNENTLVKCYSGGQLILDVESKGKPISEEGSDGYYFFTKEGKFVEINADCIFTYK